MNKLRKSKLTVFLAAILFFCFAHFDVFAQEVEDMKMIIEELNRLKQRVGVLEQKVSVQEGIINSQRRVIEKVSEISPEIKQAMLPPEPKVLVKEFILEGVYLFSEKDFEPVLGIYRNKQLGKRELEKAADDLTAFYRSKGYITSLAYLPPQEISDNVVKFSVIEGRVGEVKIEEGQYAKKEVIESKMLVEQGQVLDYERVEKSIKAINRHPDREAKAVLLPGKDKASTDLLVKIEDTHSPWHFGVDYNNRGTDYTGKNRFGLTMRNTNLLGNDEMLSARLQAGKNIDEVYAGVDYNSGTAQAGNADASITQTSGRTMSSTSGDITLTATTDVALSILSTTGNVSVTADDDTYSLANNVGEITDNLTGETAANIIAAIATLRAATGIGSLDDIETNITTLDALNSTSGNLLITEIAAGTDLNINRATQSALGNLLVQTTNGTLTVVADQNGVAVTTGTLTLIAGDSDTSYTEDLVINDTVTSTTGLVTLTSSGDDVTFGAGGDVTTTSGNVQVNAESGAGLGEGIITMTDGALIDSGTAQIDLNAYGDITLGGLTTTYTADNAVAVTSVAGGIVDGGDIHTDIVANTASAIADLDAATGIGSANALETSIFNLEANNTTSGNIKISETDAINLTEIINSGTGSIDVTAGGTMTTTTITGGGAVNLNATSGDIQDTATGKITAVGNSSLRASGIIGTRTNPIDVDVDGELWVWAGSEQDEVSAVLQGTVHTAASTERVEIYEPTPPGLVLFDNHIMGGGNSGSGSTGGSILGFGYGYVISEKSSLLSPLNAQVIQPWGYNIENIIINEQFLQGPPVVIDGSAVGVDVISPDLLISPEKFLPGVNQYIIYSQPEMGQRINKSKRPLLLTKR